MAAEKYQGGAGRHLGDEVAGRPILLGVELSITQPGIDSRAKAGLTRDSYATIDDVIYVDLEGPTNGPARGVRMPHEPRGHFCVSDG